ncbi:MAG: hypothetical protein UY36_C0006G0026, partial [Parcubacteria group bacterium GW2011_GWA1_49_11]
MTVASSTGLISWTPDAAQATTTPQSVVVQVSDGELAVAAHYSIVVSEFVGNHAPQWFGPENASTTLGELLEFDITFTDADGDDLVIT